MRRQDLIVLGAIMLVAVVLSVSSSGPPAKPGFAERHPVITLLVRGTRAAAWLLVGEAKPAPAPEPPAVMATPEEHLADNGPPLRSTGPDGHPLIDYSFGW